MIENIYSMIIVVLKFLMFIHFYACGWLLIHHFKDDNGFPHVEFSEGDKELLAQYVDSVYLMTTTITTVGYGDFNGFPDTEGHWSAEMVYLIFITITGLLIFSLLVEEIFTYKELQTVH